MYFYIALYSRGLYFPNNMVLIIISFMSRGFFFLREEMTLEHVINYRHIKNLIMVERREKNLRSLLYARKEDIMQ